MAAPEADIVSAITKLSRSGVSKHVMVPKPLLSLTGWRDGETLMFTVNPDKTVRIITLEQHIQERLDRDRLAREREPHEARL